MAKKKIPSIPPGEARFRNSEERDFTIMPNAVFFGYRGLSAGARWLYYLLRSYAWGDKAYSYPTIGGLARIQQAGENTVRRRLKELTDSGLITVESQKGHRNIYWIEPLPNTPATDGRGVTGGGGNVLRKQSSKVQEEYENERLSSSSQSILNDKTALLESLATEFAPDEQPQAIVTYLGRFPEGLLNRAAEITRQSANAKRPVAFLYGTVQRLAEQEALAPLGQQRTDTIPELTEEEYQASLQALDRVKGQLG